MFASDFSAIIGRLSAMGDSSATSIYGNRKKNHLLVDIDLMAAGEPNQDIPQKYVVLIIGK
jgi:hypothetical protein